MANQESSRSGIDNTTKEPTHLRDLSGIRVAVDSRNLDLAQGTGIKTYGLALVSALRRLNAQVSILHGRNFSTKDDIADVLFFDYQGQRRRRRFGRLRNLIFLLKAVLGPPMAAVAVGKGENSRVILQNTEKVLADIERYNIKNCYKNADLMFELLRRTQRVAIPEKIDIWHATYTLPLTVVGAKKITTIHDCIPFRLPWTTLDDKQTLYDLFKKEITGSDLIVTVSESSKNDILQLFDTDPDKIHVTYEPVHLQPLTFEERNNTAEILQQAFGLTPQKYVLYVGAIEPKKNLPRLVEAYMKIDTDVPLVVVGKKAWLWRQELRKCELVGAFKHRRVMLLNYVSTEHLRHLYAGALFFAFPSLYEGFGLPPLEAMVCGTPVLTSNRSSLPEVCGPAAVYVDPDDVISIKIGMQRLFDDAELRNELRASGIREAAKMSMDAYVDRLMSAYVRVLT